jgi:hypothetical protein
MLKRLKDNFESGLEKLKWFSSLLSERVKVEISVRDDLLKTIGRRIYELREHSDRQILKDASITEALGEIEKIDTEIESMKKKASEISKVEE